MRHLDEENKFFFMITLDRLNIISDKGFTDALRYLAWVASPWFLE